MLTSGFPKRAEHFINILRANYQRDVIVSMQTRAQRQVDKMSEHHSLSLDRS